MTATLSGQVAGDAVMVMKSYAAKIGGYDKVFNEGAVRDEGLEIAGTWTISGSISGSVLMIRPRGLLLATSRKEVAKV